MSLPNSPTIPSAAQMPDDLYTLVRTVLRYSRRFRQVLDEPLEQEIGLNTKELMVLSAIMDGFDTPSAVAERHSLPAPTVTRIVTKLVGDQLVIRVTDPSDLRRQRLQLTAKGETARIRTRQNARSIVQKHFGHLNPADIDAVLLSLKALEAGLFQPAPEVKA